MLRRIFIGLPLLIASFFVGYSITPSFRIHEEAANCEAKLESPATSVSIEPPSSSTQTPDQVETIDEVNDLLDNARVKYPVRLLVTGELGYEFSDVPAKNGERWLGLFEENGKYSVRSTKLRISKDENNMIAVDVPGANKPLFMFKDADGIRSGKVTSVFRTVDYVLLDELNKRGVQLDDRSGKIDDNFEQTFELNGEKYKLAAAKAKNAKGEIISALFPHHGEQRQVLQTVSHEITADMGYINWIGDLDHDGRPDFFFDLNDGAESVEGVLFLSSMAKKGGLVRKVAELWYPGC
ncbi:MAG: hypothetical protein ABI878_16325 [Acidobacteriota bacterium]